MLTLVYNNGSKNKPLHLSRLFSHLSSLSHSPSPLLHPLSACTPPSSPLPSPLPAAENATSKSNLPKTQFPQLLYNLSLTFTYLLLSNFSKFAYIPLHLVYWVGGSNLIICQHSTTDHYHDEINRTYVVEHTSWSE